MKTTEPLEDSNPRLSLEALQPTTQHARPIAPIAPGAPIPGAIVRSPIRLSDMALFHAAFSRLGQPISDTSFAISFGWSSSLDLTYAIIDEHLCLFSAADGDLTMILPPLPLTRTADALLGGCLDRCFDIMDEANGPDQLGRSRIEYISDEMLDRIRAIDTQPLSASPMPGDYVYPCRAMIELAGGPLKGKRKLRSKFTRENPDYTIAPITGADVEECAALLSLWRSSADERHEGEANERLIGTDILRQRDEQFTLALLGNLEGLGLDSMLVRAGGRLVGFTIGERLTPTQAVIYVEKTDPSVAGTPQFIFSSFCEVNFPDVEEINVGDDWGIESLRYTKMSYRPSRMIGKSLLTRQPVPEVNAVETMTVRGLESSRSAPLPAPLALASTGDFMVTTMTPTTSNTSTAMRSTRAARKDDTGAIQALEAACFPAEDRFTARQIRRLIDNPRARVLVAEDDDRVTGWIVGLIRSHQRWRSGRIYGVAVDPARAGRGFGRALLTQCIEHLSQTGINRIYLEVRADNTPAINLYKSLGFVFMSNLADYYGDGVPGIRMRRVSDSNKAALPGA